MCGLVVTVPSLLTDERLVGFLYRFVLRLWYAVFLFCLITTATHYYYLFSSRADEPADSGLLKSNLRAKKLYAPLV